MRPHAHTHAMAARRQTIIGTDTHHPLGPLRAYGAVVILASGLYDMH